MTPIPAPGWWSWPPRSWGIFSSHLRRLLRRISFLPLTSSHLPLSNANVCASCLLSVYHAQMVIEGPYKNYLSWGCRACSCCCCCGYSILLRPRPLPLMRGERERRGQRQWMHWTQTRIRITIRERPRAQLPFAICFLFLLRCFIKFVSSAPDSSCLPASLPALSCSCLPTSFMTISTFCHCRFDFITALSVLSVGFELIDCMMLSSLCRLLDGFSVLGSVKVNWIFAFVRLTVAI